MKVLIIGGTGFIGRHVTRLFAANGHTVAIFNRGTKTFDGELTITGFAGDRNDILHFKQPFLAFGPDVVIDTIAFTAQHMRHLQVVLEGVCDRLVVLSSCDVYQAYDNLQKGLPEIDPVPLKETAPLRSQLYPMRQMAEGAANELLWQYDKILVEQMAQQGIARTTILRLPGVFGPADPHKKLDEYIVPMLGGHPSITLSPGRAAWVWSRSYVQNIAQAVYLATLQPTTRHDIFNLGDIHLTELAMVKKLKKLTGWQGRIIIEDDAGEDSNFAQHLHTGSAKFKRRYAYTPPVDVDEALRQTIQQHPAHKS